MRKITYTILAILVSLWTSGQTQLLKNYDFNKGGYCILGIRSESDPSSLQDSLGDFYTNDIKILNEFKKDWIFKTPSPQYSCGYHYIIYICKNGKCLEDFAVNLNCNEIATDKAYFFFDSKKLRKFYGHLKTANVKFETMESIEQGKKYINSILKDTSLLMVSNPIWNKYEGEFTFRYKCQVKENEFCFDKEPQILIKLNDQIKKVYPGEIFDLEGAGGSKDELTINIKCNKSLSDKFNLYPLGWSKWEYFKLYLTTAWKK